MRHEVIRLPETGVELETYLTDNRAVEADRIRPECQEWIDLAARWLRQL